MSPGSPNYVQDLCLREDNIDFCESRPYVGVYSSAMGFSLSEVYVDEKMMVVSDRCVQLPLPMLNLFGTLHFFPLSSRLSSSDYILSNPSSQAH